MVLPEPYLVIPLFRKFLGEMGPWRLPPRAMETTRIFTLDGTHTCYLTASGTVSLILTGQLVDA
jgi:hypothetical protein